MGIARPLAIFLATVTLYGVAFAQTNPIPGMPNGSAGSVTLPSRGSIHGRIVMPDGTPSNQAVKVTVQQSVRGGTYATLYTDQQGQFEIENISPGQYTLEIEADQSSRFEVSTERVQILRGSASFVTISLKEKQTPGDIKPVGVVSASELNQKVPSKAAKEFERATKASAEGNTVEAIDHLQKAIAIYPEYLMAHNDLGAQLLNEGQFKEAADHLRAAIKIDPKAFNPRLNLGIALAKQSNFPDALTELDKALSLGPGSAAAHLYAGMAAGHLQEIERAEKDLKAAHDIGGAPFAVALFHLGQIYLSKGERELALNSFEIYLREAPDATNAPQVQKLMGTLRR